MVGCPSKEGKKLLIVGGFYSEVALQKREAEGTVRTKHQLNLNPTPGGTQKILDDRRYGGREEQRKAGPMEGHYRVPSLFSKRSNQALRPGPPPKPLSK